MNHELTPERTAVFAEEAAVVDAQSLLHQLMEAKGWSRADLARAMNVSRARVTQIFSDDCKNFTVRLLARAMSALGEELHLSAKSQGPEWMHAVLEEGRAKDRCTNASMSWLEVRDCDFADQEPTANDNFFSGLASLRRLRAQTYELAA
jgi:transcriptional regulator with XRE-family HTH domain